MHKNTIFEVIPAFIFAKEDSSKMFCLLMYVCIYLFKIYRLSESTKDRRHWSLWGCLMLRFHNILFTQLQSGTKQWCIIPLPCHMLFSLKIIIFIYSTSPTCINGFTFTTLLLIYLLDSIFPKCSLIHSVILLSQIQLFNIYQSMY